MTTFLQIPGADSLVEAVQDLPVMQMNPVDRAFDTANRAMEMGQIIGLVTVILLFVGIPLLIFFLARNRHREKLALIEKGLNPNPVKPENGYYKALMWGMLLGGAGLGFIIGVMLETFVPLHGVVFASMAFFAGAGLVGYFFYRSQQERPDNSEKP